MKSRADARVMHTYSTRGFGRARRAPALDGHAFQGRLMHLLAARPHQKAILPASRGATTRQDVQDSNTFKGMKEIHLKASATQQEGWKSLFMRPRQCAMLLASRYRVSKTDFLDATGNSSLGVKLAQGEANISIRPPSGWRSTACRSRRCSIQLR